MAGALKPPAAKGRVKLDIAPARTRPPVQTQGEPAPATTAAPNPSLQANIEAADAKDVSKEADTKEKSKPSRSATVLKVVKDVADATDARPSRKPPTAEEWEKPISRALVYVSVLYIWWLTTDDDGNELGDTREYELDDERASLISSPFARLWARTPLNRRYGRDMIENVDILVAVSALVTYVMDTRPLLAAKRARQQARETDNKVLPMRKAQTTTAPSQSTKTVESQQVVTNTNGGTQPSEQTDRPIEGPYARPLPFTPGEQNSSD